MLNKNLLRMISALQGSGGGGGSGNSGDVELTAEDNELVFQVGQTSLTYNNYFPDADETAHPLSMYEVYINDEKVDKPYNAISYNNWDVVKIVDTGVGSFPPLKSTNLHIRNIAKLPYMTDANGDGVTSAYYFLFNCPLKNFPGDLFENNPQITDTSACFYSTDIESIPQDLFTYTVGLESTGSVFSYCTSLTSVPESLFASCPSLTSASGAFSSSGITSIPENLFANNPELTSVSSCFRNTPITSIPENLFANNPSLEIVEWCFRETKNLTSIPEDLFANNPDLADADYCFCQSGITSIPQGLFANNAKLTNVSTCFKGTNITEIPSGLFDNNPKLLNLHNCFQNCQITTIPDRFFTSCMRAGPNMFDGSKLKTIPSNLFERSNNFDYISQMFARTEIEEIPEGLFKGVYSSTMTISGCFMECKELTKVPSDLFSNIASVGNLTKVFYGCEALTNVPYELLQKNTSLTTLDEMFGGCTTLSCRLKIGSSRVSSAKDFCKGAGAITVEVPAGTTTEATFRSVAETCGNLSVVTY